jgi:hypothetical protein
VLFVKIYIEKWEGHSDVFGVIVTNDSWTNENFSSPTVDLVLLELTSTLSLNCLVRSAHEYRISLTNPFSGQQKLRSFAHSCSAEAKKSHLIYSGRSSSQW